MKLQDKTTFPPGTVLVLNERQAKDRAHAIKSLGDNCFEAIQHLQFKAGEEVGVETELPKSLLSSIENNSGANHQKQTKRKKQPEQSGDES